MILVLCNYSAGNCSDPCLKRRANSYDAFLSFPPGWDEDTQKTLHKLNSLHFSGAGSLIPVKCKVFNHPCFMSF